MKRTDWVDSSRFFAIFVIIFTHFLDKTCPSALLLWTEPPAAYFLFGLTGKLSVAFFCVLLGYYASKPRELRLRSFVSYSLRRYFQFAFFILVTALVYVAGSYVVTWLFHSPDNYIHTILSDGPRYNLIYILRDSFLFECTYNDALWCMGQFFIASLLCWLLGSLFGDRRPLAGLLVSAVLTALLLATGMRYWSWVANCILGYVLRLYLSYTDGRPALKSPGYTVLLFVVSVCLIKAPLEEDVLLYYLEGLGSLLLLIVLFRLDFVHRLFAHRPFPWLGRISIGLFITHTPVNSLLHSSFYPLLHGRIPEPLLLCVYFAVLLAIVIFASWLLDLAYRRVSAVLFRDRTAAAV